MFPVAGLLSTATVVTQSSYGEASLALPAAAVMVSPCVSRLINRSQHGDSQG